jgi:Spy/CpxP family protein refolding chaperone
MIGRLTVWAALAASLSANVVLVTNSVRHRAQPAPSGVPVVFSRTAVDAEQRARIVELRAAVVAKRDAHAQEISKLREQLAATIARTPDDRPVVDSLLARISASQAAFQHAVVDHVLAVRAVLRPDQRAAFEDVIATQLNAGSALQPAADDKGR